MTRKAFVAGARSRREIEAYLPDNYRVTFEGENEGRPVFEIEGEDVAGWTLDGYVIPRLASGLIYAEEVTENLDEVLADAGDEFVGPYGDGTY